MTTLHIDLILDLRVPAENGLAPDALLTDMRRGRHRNLSEPELLAALRDLADKALVIPFDGALGTRRWRITGRGEAALKEEGL